MSTKFLSPGWRMPRNANQSKQASYSLHFTPGSVTNVNLGDALSFFIGSFSASMWVKSPNNGREFFSRYISANGVGNFRIGCGANAGATANTVSLMTKNILLSGSTDIRDGNWHHVCVTMDAISSTQYTRTIYVDGSQDAQDTVSLATYVSTSSSYGLNLGCNFPNNGHTNVDMSEVSIFDYALSSSQVTTLYGDSTNGVGNPMAFSVPPIAYYPLGTSAWNGNYLAENNAIGDYVFDFNGSNDYIDTGSADYTEGITTMSISGWFNPNAAGSSGAAGIVAKESRDFYVGWYSVPANSIRFLISDDDGATNDSLNSLTLGSNTDVLGKWHHFVCTWDASDKLKIYINGNFSSETNSVYATSALPTSTNILEIGRRVSTYFDGAISNIQIFNTALSATEAETLYNYGSPIRTLANIPQSSNLKAWYKLDASEVYNSTTTEWSIDNNQNPSAYASSLNFNGSSNYIDCGTGSRFNINQITISAWVKLSSGLTSTQIIAGIRNASAGSICYQLQNQASGKFRFVISQSNGTYVDSVANDVHQYNTWYHVLGVADGSNIKLYVNGNLQTIVSSYDGTIYSPNENFNIGRQSSPSNYYWDGELSNVSVFNIGLTSAQVTEIYNNGTPSSLSSHSATSNLVSWYKLNNTTTGIEDAKGSNNGTNYGATEYTGFVNKLVGDSSGMSQANLVQSDLQTVAPYSKYAMNFLGTDNDYIDCGNSALTAISGGSNTLTTSMTLSTWFKLGSSSASRGLIGFGDLNNNYGGLAVRHESGVFSFLRANQHMVSGGYSFSDTTNWHNMVFVYDPNNADNCKVYIDSVNVNLSFVNVGSVSLENKKLTIGAYYGLSDTFTGELSNFSTWNTTLTSAQVTEIYNQGLPSNLNSHSAYSNLVSWWQLGENSSFTGDWIFADEKGSNNGDGQNMTEANLINGVGTTANGVSNGMSEGNLVGDAPYSTANALSTNMVITSRVSGVSDATITTGGTGYVTGTNIATTGGSGTNCTINITTVSGGVITAITINNGGSNYVIGDVLTISGGNGNATITVSGLNTP